MHYTLYFINLFIYGKYSVKPDRKNNSTKATNPDQKYLTNRLYSFLMLIKIVNQGFTK